MRRVYCIPYISFLPGVLFAYDIHIQVILSACFLASVLGTDSDTVKLVLGYSTLIKYWPV